MVVLGGIVLVLAFAWRMQERILFQPPPFRPPDSGAARAVRYAASDGAALTGFIVGGARTDGRCVLAFHGNADLAYWQIPWAEELRRRTGIPVFLAEYRGYAGIPGRPTYGSARDDAEGAFSAAVRELRCSPGTMALFGHSLGSAVATELAVAHPPRSLVLQSPFSSARAMARRILPPVAAAWPLVSRIHFDTARDVSQLDVPVFVAHGLRDVIIPVKLGTAVHAAARNKGDLLLVEGAGHNDVEAIGGERYWEWLRKAVNAD